MTRSKFEIWQNGFLTFEKVSGKDLPFLTSFLTLPELSAHKPDPTPATDSAIAALLRADIEHWQCESIGRWVVRRDGQAIGMSGLTVKAGHSGLNISYHIVPENWGQGIASDMVEAMLTLAPILKDRYSRFYGMVRAANPASIRVLEKAGFEYAEMIDLGGSPSQLFTYDIVDS